jgi:peptide/nickel transport system ATP-binding protein
VQRLLEIKNLSVVYRDGDHSIQALEDVSLEIKAGQCVALVGESGSGKTTLGKACLGLLPDNADHKGEVLLDGEKIDFSDEALLNRLRWKRLSMVFQDGAASLNPVHRIIDQVAEPIIQHEGVSKDKVRKRAALFLEEIGLPKEFHGRYPHQLSGGQVQRALLAMAMILDPAVIILDEPTSALDALTKGFVAEVIREAKGRGKALLLITHDLEFAMHNAEIMAVLYLGQIMETLPADEMLSHPLHPYTMALGRSYPAMDTARDLGGIRGDAFYRIIHQHGHGDAAQYRHAHIQAPKLSHSDVHAPPTGCLFHDRCTQAIASCKEGVVALEGSQTVWQDGGAQSPRSEREVRRTPRYRGGNGIREDDAGHDCGWRDQTEPGKAHVLWARHGRVDKEGSHIPCERDRRYLPKPR